MEMGIAWQGCGAVEMCEGRKVRGRKWALRRDGGMPSIALLLTHTVMHCRLLGGVLGCKTIMYCTLLGCAWMLYYNVLYTSWMCAWVWERRRMRRALPKGPRHPTAIQSSPPSRQH